MDSRFYKSFNIIVKITSLVFIASLFSCSSSNSGGGIALYSVGGTVTGLQGIVTLRNNATDIRILNSTGDFSFQNKLSDGASYNVVIQAQPSGETCKLNNASGIIVNADVTNIIVSCEAGVSVSGSYQATPLIQVDSDINDPFAVANINNSSFFEAQTITNFSTVHGFVTLAGTSASTGTDRTVYGDRFASSEDEVDFYRANLQKNQTLRLQVADFEGLDEFKGDLDLYLYDSDSMLVSSSISHDDEFENIIVPADGDYYIQVIADSGSSKYTLNLNIVTPLNITRQNSVDFVPGEAIIKFKPNTAINNFKTSQQQMALKHQKTTRTTLASFDVNSVSNASVSSRLKTKPGFIDELKQRNVVSYQKFKTLQQIKQLKLRDDVEYAEPNYLYKPLLVPNDEFYNLQWHYPAINLPQAWDITTGSRVGSDVIVAVVDTGVFLNHPELANQLVDGYDFISDITNAADGDGGIDDDPDDPGDSAQLDNSSWHGTHVAGTIAAETDNNDDVAGIAWQAKIMPLRVLGTQGGTNYDIIQAIRYVAGLSNDSKTVPVQKADIINLSLGGSGYSQAAQDAYDAVRAEGVIVVAAAGNESSSQLSYPASYDGVVSVSATDFANNRAPYSNFGSKIDVAAPGGNQVVDLNNDGFSDGVLSTLVDDSSGTRVATLEFYQGTSMAAPHVSGVFALMRAVYPALSPDDIDSLLFAGTITTDLGAAGRDDVYGHGLLDALKAVQMAQLLENGGTLPDQPARIVATPSQLTMGATSTATLLLSNEGGTDTPITGVTVDASWLVVTEKEVDVTSGLGEYQLTIVRTGLSNSSYLGSITFTLETGTSVKVQVSMDVGPVDKSGNAGTVYILLLDTNNGFVDQVLASDSGNGVFDYSFNNVITGAYRVVAGSDIDNDLSICQLAEVCGGYPTIDALSTVDVNGSPIAGLDFFVDIQTSLRASSLSPGFKTGASGFERRVPPVPDNKQFFTSSGN